ncbi:MAG: alpha/beta fold hydrolase [Burkholderiales bacterium]
MRLTEGTFHIGEVEIHYTECVSSGAPLLLLHGFSQSRRYWSPIVEPIGADKWIFSLDRAATPTPVAKGKRYFLHGK